MRYLLLALALVWPFTVDAQAHSVRECSEGSDFIRNAALSRDSGTTHDFFVERLENDLVMIRAFPAALRWFVHSPDDEVFLRAEVEAVFDTPRNIEQHRSGFMERCVRRAERLGSPSG
jgi:hypothetical protein